MNKKIMITADGVCDLSEELLYQYNVSAIHFYVSTDHGRFRDLDEITAANIIEYFENGGQYIATHAPTISDFEIFFQKHFDENECDELIHITISSLLSNAYEYAQKAAEKFDGRVHIFDSGHLSAGVAHFVIKAAEMAKEGKSKDEIWTVLEEMRGRVSTSFISNNADCLYLNNRVSTFVKNVCTLLKIHPILSMRDGNMYLKSVLFGNYNNAMLRYVRNELKRAGKTESKRIFIVHAGCTLKTVSAVKKTVFEKSYFEEVLILKASATISSNCGRGSLGILFVRE